MHALHRALAALLLAAGIVAAPAAQTASPRWFKGNTHTHTLNSDGDSTPDEVVRWYREHGYHFLVLTDHNHLTSVDGLNALHGADEKFLVIKGQEVTDQFGGAPLHINGLDISRRVAPQGGTSIPDVLQRNIDAIRAADGVPHINHPNFRWAMSAEDLKQVRNNRLFEIYNGHPQVNNLGGGTVPGLEEVWDAILSSGIRLYGIAVDDAHHFKSPGDPSAAGPGRGWIVVRAARLEARALLEAMELGDFYASTGVELSDYAVNASSMTVTVKQTSYSKYRIQFIGEGGAVLHEATASPATYTFSGNERYVRAKVIESNGAVAWLQPAFPRQAAAAARDPGVHVLKPGEAEVRRIGAGGIHAYAIEAAAGEYVEVGMNQRGIDVLASVTDPEGQPLGTFDTPNGHLGPETPRFLAAADGRYRLDVRAAIPETEPGEYEIALTTRRPAGERDRKVVAALEAQADAARLRQNPDTRRASLDRYREVMALWREAGDAEGYANALRAMGFAYVRLREDDEAYTVFAETRPLWRELGDARAEAFASLILGTIHTRRGEPAETRARAMEALPLFEQAGDRMQTAFTIAEVGSTYAAEKDREKADRWFDRALALARETARPSLEAALLSNRARAYERLGATADAIASYESSVVLWEKAGMPIHAANTRKEIARLAGG